MSNILEIPKVATIGLIALGNNKEYASLMLHQPQIIQHLAFLPIQTANVRISLLETIRLIEEFRLEQDIIVRESHSQSYNTAVFENRTNNTVIVPPATHMKGGQQNRGNNMTEVLEPNDESNVNVNCFEPGRGHGSDHFTEFDDVPADVAQETMRHTNGYDGSWNMIRDYTALVKGISDTALSAFNEKTKETRAKFALNFETVVDQTGVIIITNELTMIEIFPTPNCFNIYSQRILRGKVASLFYKMHEKAPTALILPSQVDEKMNEAIKIVQKAINDTYEKHNKNGGMIVGRARQDKKAIDIILTDTDPPQIAYMFGVW